MDNNSPSAKYVFIIENLAACPHFKAFQGRYHSLRLSRFSLLDCISIASTVLVIFQGTNFVFILQNLAVDRHYKHCISIASMVLVFETLLYSVK